MSALIAHAKAYRILAGRLAANAEDCGDEGHALLLARLSKSYAEAATEILELAATECSGTG